MGIQAHFNDFHKRIKLGRNDGAYKTARERDDSIKADVIESFKKEGYPVVKDFMQGSMKTNTGVRPISGDYDIDRALVINAEDAPSNPVIPKKRILEVLEDRGFQNAKIKKPCVTADYASDKIHIDLVVYKLSGNQHYLAVGKENSDEENREWAESDPIGLIEWVNDASKYGSDAGVKHAQFRRLVRYLKRWRDVQFSEAVASKVFSIGLTLMAKREFEYSFSVEGAPQDLDALYATVKKMSNAGYFWQEKEDRYRVSVKLPVCPWRDIFTNSSLETGTQLRNKLDRLATKLADAIEETDEVKQCEILNELFGSDFKVPVSSSSNSNDSPRRKFASAGFVGTSQGA